MNDWRNYDEISREELTTRLRAAEDACVFVGWTASLSGSERAAAATELWQRWARLPGVDTSVDANRELAAATKALAAACQAVRDATQARIAASRSSAEAAVPVGDRGQGRCGSMSPLVAGQTAQFCVLTNGHGGMHEGPKWYGYPEPTRWTDGY